MHRQLTGTWNPQAHVDHASTSHQLEYAQLFVHRFMPVSWLVLAHAQHALLQVLAALQRWSVGRHAQQDLDVIMACPALAPEVKHALTNSDPQVPCSALHCNTTHHRFMTPPLRSLKQCLCLEHMSSASGWQTRTVDQQQLFLHAHLPIYQGITPGTSPSPSPQLTWVHCSWHLHSLPLRGAAGVCRRGRYWWALCARRWGRELWQPLWALGRHRHACCPPQPLSAATWMP